MSLCPHKLNEVLVYKLYHSHSSLMPSKLKLITHISFIPMCLLKISMTRLPWELLLKCFEHVQNWANGITWKSPLSSVSFTQNTRTHDLGTALILAAMTSWRQSYNSKQVPHLSTKTLVTERGLGSLKILSWYFSSSLKCLWGENIEPILNNKMVIKMRIIIVGVSGFDSLQRKCIGSAFEEEPTFQPLLLSSSHSPLSMLWCSWGKSFTGARPTPIAFPQSPYNNKSKPFCLYGVLGLETASTSLTSLLQSAQEKEALCSLGA